MALTSTRGYEAESSDAEAIVSEILAELAEATSDPTELYHRLTAAQALHEGVVRRLTQEREVLVARLNEGSDRMSYEKIAAMIGKSRSAAQQMVERGREHSTRR